MVAHTFNPSTWESHAFNPSTRKVETGRDIAGWKEDYKVAGDRSSGHLVCGFIGTGSPLWSEDAVGVRTLAAVALLLWSFNFHPLISDSWFLLLKPIRIHTTDISENSLVITLSPTTVCMVHVHNCACKEVDMMCIFVCGS